jgi:DNA-binding response OmpR family regulator
MHTILLVDDDQDTLIAQEALLEDAGYHTVTAWGGEEGLQALESGKVDLLLLDDYLPGVDSSRLVEEARELGSPVLMLTTAKLPREVTLNGCETVHKWTLSEVRKKVDQILKNLPDSAALTACV